MGRKELNYDERKENECDAEISYDNNNVDDNNVECEYGLCR
jgi:hypothetical protein